MLEITEQCLKIYYKKRLLLKNCKLGQKNVDVRGKMKRGFTRKVRLQEEKYHSWKPKEK